MTATRVLVLHSRYRSGDASGENRVVDDEVRLLADAGHDVRSWMPATDGVAGIGLIRAGANAIHSRSAAQEVRRIVRDHRSEVVHCHNLFPGLSPAVLGAAADEGAAVVLTLHNYRLSCLPATLLRNGRVCEDCVGRVPWRGVLHRCYRDSVLASGTLAASLALHRTAGTFERVHLFLAVSEFLRRKHVDAGVRADRILVKPNFVSNLLRRRGPGEYFLVLGRLSPEKGVATVLAAHRPEHGRVLVVGDGPQRRLLQAMGSKHVELRQQVPATEVPALLSRARAVLLPSRSYEGAPRTVLEAYAAGVPVIASRIGSIVELVDDGSSGMLVAVDDVGAWTSAMTRLRDDSESRRLGVNAARLWEARFAPSRGLCNLESAYEAALEVRARTRSALRSTRAPATSRSTTAV